jgi:UDP-GlcNAc:undecaprenyl-phosphate GlcNAc-1-phosphate transferase
MMPVFAFGLAFLTSLVGIPLVRRISFRWNAVAQPRQDRWHRKPTPLLGGVGIFAAFLLTILTLSLLYGEALEIRWGLLAGSGMVFLLGLYDDIKQMTPPAKLLGQILAAALVVFLGYTTNFFTPRIPDNILAQIPNTLLTFIWLVGITNAINLLDNMDGLAGGLALIAAAILSFFFWRVDNESLLLISLALGGSLLGFLIFNFPPASIFMGDSGSLFLGFTLAVLAIARQPQASNVFAVMGVPTLLFLLPILDTILVTFTRMLRGQSPIQGGRDHASHRLIAFGLSERQAVLALYGVALVSGVLAAALESLNYLFSLVLAPLLVIALTLLIAYLGGLKVVTDPARTSPDKAITRFILDITYRRRLLEIILDFFLIGVAYYLAFLVGFDLAMSADNLEMFVSTVPIAWTGVYLSFFYFGVYRGLWRYVGVDDLVRYIKAALGGVALIIVPVYLISSPQVYPAVILILFPVFLFLGLAASRSSFKILDQVYAPQVRTSQERVLIYGAGDAGELALRWILMNPQLGYQPVGFLDDDAFKMGRQIHGIEVLGDLDRLDSILVEHRVDGLIFTLDAPPGDGVVKRVASICHARQLWVRQLRFEFELLE